jgi:hypothetical protein
MIVACGGVYFWGASWLKSNVTDNPVEIQKINSEICTIKVPDGFTPSFGLRANIPFMPKTLGKMVAYTDGAATPGVLFMIEVGEFGDANAQEQLQEQFAKQAQQKNGQQGTEKLTDVVTSTVERKINKAPAEFHISEGMGERSHKKKIRVNGTFRGRSGPAVITFEAFEEKVSKEKVEEMIDSIE